MVPDSPDCRFVHEGECFDLGSVNDHFSPIGNDRLQLVHRFSTHPKVFIESRRYCQDCLVRTFNVGYMETGRIVSRPGPRLDWITSKQADRLILGIDDKGKACAGGGNELRRPVNDSSRQGIFDAVHLQIRQECAQPMKGLNDIEARDPGKKVLVPACKSHRLVRHDGCNQENVIVLKDFLVDRDRNRLRKNTLCQSRDFVGRDRPDRGKRGWIRMFVIEEPDAGKGRSVLVTGDSNMPVDSLRFHVGMSAGGNKEIECADSLYKKFMENMKKKIDTCVPRVVGNKDQNALAIQSESPQSFLTNLHDLRILEGLFGSPPDDRGHFAASVTSVMNPRS